MDKDARQLLIGFGNRAIIYQYDEKKQHSLPIKDILSGLNGLFKEEDVAINSHIPNGVKAVKTGEPTMFRSERILSSLIKIGMPIELAVRTLEKVIEEITVFVSQNKHLSTKDIRRIVSGAIRKIESIDDFDAEEWSYRYTRKYGHDSRQIEIYNYPVLGQVKVSYAVISDVIKAAFERIIPKEAVMAIPRAQMDHMSEYVIEFINGCELYYIEYNTLINMINELSRQPPHPWLITDSTRELLKNYDAEAIQSNLDKLVAETLFDEETYCYLEIIHHGASLILQKYQWFLGTEDFSAFYILISLLKKYKTLDFKQIRETNNTIQHFERDLVLAGYSISEFQEMLSEVQAVIQVKRHPSEENRALLTEFGNLAINLSHNKSRNELINSIHDDWTTKATDSTISILYKLLKTLTHGSGCEKLPITPNMFRFVYANSIEVKHRNLKKQYIVVYVDTEFDFCSLEKLNSRRYRDYADVILVCSNSDVSDEIITQITAATNDQYWVVPFKKDNMINIITEDNASEYFYSLLYNYID